MVSDAVENECPGKITEYFFFGDGKCSDENVPILQILNEFLSNQVLRETN